jgi:hypothetical protein
LSGVKVHQDLVTQESGKKCRKIYIYIYIYIFSLGGLNFCRAHQVCMTQTTLEHYHTSLRYMYHDRRLRGMPDALLPTLEVQAHLLLAAPPSFQQLATIIKYVQYNKLFMSLPLVASHFSLANSHHLTSSHTPSDERLRETPSIVHRYGWVC